MTEHQRGVLSCMVLDHAVGEPDDVEGTTSADELRACSSAFSEVCDMVLCYCMDRPSSHGPCQSDYGDVDDHSLLDRLARCTALITLTSFPLEQTENASIPPPTHANSTRPAKFPALPTTQGFIYISSMTMTWMVATRRQH